MKSKVFTAVMLATAVLVLGLTGCGKKAGTETETVKQTETQAQTVATEVLTEAEEITEAAPAPVLEAVTEAAIELEAITEAAAEVVTEAPKDLTSDEEQDAETDYTEPVVLYAKDDLNIRSNPSTEEENIISSFDQGEEVTVVGETPNWYIISKDGFTGYVRKDGLSEEEVEPKSPEEREEANGSSSATDVQYNVSIYAESFPVHVAGDANLRAEPSETGDVIGTINADTNVNALGETDEWYKVEAEDGTVGFVHKNLIG